MHWQLAAVAAVLLTFAAVSGRLEGTWLTAPMVFTAAGLVVGVEALGLVDPDADGFAVKALAEATLAVVLFSDASRIDLRALRSELGLP
ncbi:MAG: sodium:proton antiporter, partial [Gaiellaceae bacterium]